MEGTPLERLDFLSLMLALFLGTAALPHILIRYYTVPNPAAARKSTIVAIAAIGLQSDASLAFDAVVTAAAGSDGGAEAAVVGRVPLGSIPEASGVVSQQRLVEG